MSIHKCLRRALGVALFVVPVWATATPINFSFNYLDGAGEGFNDAANGAAAKAALDYAGSIWGSYLPASYVGETIHVSVYMDSLGTSGANTLAFASSMNLWWNNAKYPQQSTIYGSALANHFAGKDLSTTADEIKVTFNADKLFYYGTDFNAVSPSYDFVSLALHEMGHGLGFFSRIDHDNSDSSFGGMLTSTSSSTGISNQYPSIYDRFLVDGNGVKLIDMTDADRAVAITSSNVFWSGANAAAANGGVYPEIYAPAALSAGSSLTHFDDATHFLLDPNLAKGEDVRVDAVTLGVLKDIGWTIAAVPEPSSYAMFLAGLLGLAALKRRRS